VERVDWLDALPTGVQGVIVANEVVDALAVERFVKRSDKAGDIWRVGVTLAEASDRDTPFKDQAMQATPELVARVTAVEAELETRVVSATARSVGAARLPATTVTGRMTMPIAGRDSKTSRHADTSGRNG